MIAQEPAIGHPQPQTSDADKPEPISFNRIIGLLQVALATRRAAETDEDQYWFTVARGM